MTRIEPAEPSGPKPIPAWKRLLVVAVALGGMYAIKAIYRRSSLGDPCTTGGECGDGAFCTTDGYCTLPCDDDGDCRADMECREGRTGDSAKELQDGFFRRDVRACIKKR